MGWMNLASILLGLAGWGLPVWGLKRWMRGRRKNLDFAAGGADCAAAERCGFQLGYSAHLAEIGDWPAWMDTADAVSAVSGFLLVTTALVNGAAVLLSRQEDD